MRGKKDEHASCLNHFFCFARINSQLHCLKKRNPSYKAREKNQTRFYVIEINLPAYRNKRS